MPSGYNKNRLYLALYPSGTAVGREERRYHWAFLIGPKAERHENVPGNRYHVKTTFNGWKYEEVPLENVRATNTLLARLTIAKIEDEARLIYILRSIPVVQNDPNWFCCTWVQQALSAIAQDIANGGGCVGTSILNWRTIETFGRQYVQNKTAAGRYQYAADMLKPKPTYDLIEEKETVP